MTVAVARAPLSRAGTEVACTHCGLPVPRGLVEPDADAQFCCGGCRAVYETIRRCGLDRYYAICDAPVRVPAAPPRSDYAAFDDAAFIARHVARQAPLPPPGRPVHTIDLHVERAHCAACVWLLERLPRVQPGVRSARLDIRRKTLRIEWDPEATELSTIAERLDALGYPPAPCTERDVDRARRRESREHLVRVGVAGACAGNAMLIAFALYGGMFSGMDETHRVLLRGASLLITLVAVAWPGRVFFSGAIASLRAGALHMDVPVAVALGLGTVWGAVNTVRGTGEVYFESLTTVVFLLLIGRWIQHRQHCTAHEAVERLYDLTPAQARVIGDDGHVRTVAARTLTRGDRVELRAGDSVPADGTIVEGTSAFDLSMLTGESRPVTLAPGAPAHAGTTNLSARVVLRTERTGAETRLGRLATLIEDLASGRPPIVRLADRLAQRFVRVVLVLAAATCGLWLVVDPAQAVEHTIALLIVTCPCALGLATPLAVVAAIGRAAREGMMVKGGAVLERLARPGPRGGIVLLDKTGTLTEGTTRLVRWDGDHDARALAAAVERHAAHPAARALVADLSGDRRLLVVHATLPALELAGAPGAGGVACTTMAHAAPQAQDVVVTSRGAHGTVGARMVVVGAPDFVREHGTSPMPRALECAEHECTAAALTPVLVAVDGHVVAVAGLGDPVREDAADAVAALRRLGWTVGVLSGDHPSVVASVADRVGVDADRREGGATPERKVEAIRAARDEFDTVVMVGDGVNDAAALTAADVGIAVSGGAEASLRAADVFLQHPDLTGIASLIRGSGRTVGVIRRNLFASLFYNAVTGSLAVAGVINPLIAAAIMPLSSLTVVTLSFRSRTFDGETR